MKDYNQYQNPLISRYASKDMSFIWSPQKKFSTWRELWIALAKAEKELGLNITDEQIQLMENNVDNIDFDLAAQYEKGLRHDVMSHVHAWGDQIPKAKAIIHLGATSCYVGDNTDIIQLKEAIELVRKKLLVLLEIMGQRATQYKDLATLAFTHYQPAQFTTVGKRICLWIQDLLLDFERLDLELEKLPMRGVKGTTGTQASFLELFKGDHDKVKTLNTRVTKLMGFEKTIPVSGQTYTRKIDFQILSCLSGIASSLYKFAGDFRLLSNLGEFEEPFQEKQIGSSAMAYKRNPMRCERICSIARFVMNLLPNTLDTHANQWFERTLDDSANRRLTLPEAFLGIDAILGIAINVFQGFNVREKVIEKNMAEQLPFIATENIIMQCVEQGGKDRQDLHELIRKYSILTAKNVKEKGEGTTQQLLEFIKADENFSAAHNHIDSILDCKNYIGRADQQVSEFIKEELETLLNKYSIKSSDASIELKV